jgi:hypothetical protein
MDFGVLFCENIRTSAHKVIFNNNISLLHKIFKNYFLPKTFEFVHTD